MSLIFSFAEKLYAAWPKDKTGNINQFLLPFCGVRKFLFFRLGQYSAPGSKTPKGLGLLVKITVKGGKLCTNELKQCVSHGTPAFSLFARIYGHSCDRLCPKYMCHGKSLYQKNLRYV